MKQEIPKELEEKFKDLQLLEQNLQNFNMQKQKFQIELVEIENALKELNDEKKETYKIVSNIMIEASPIELKKELESKKEVINLRIKNLEKQETNIRNKAEEIQKEVMSKLQKK